MTTNVPSRQLANLPTRLGTTGGKKNGVYKRYIVAECFIQPSANVWQAFIVWAPEHYLAKSRIDWECDLWIPKLTPKTIPAEIVHEVQRGGKRSS